MAKARLIPTQVRRRDTINKRFPNRDKGSDGWIADENHKPPSGHIPDKKGWVRATDTDKDGIHVPSVIAGDLLHPATWYVIHNRRIYSRSRDFRPAKYTGKNPHTGHIHRSTLGGHDDDRTVYRLTDGTTGRWGTLRKGDKGGNVRELQALLIGNGATISMDNDFGPDTERAVKAFQVARKVPNSVKNGQGDGIVGLATRNALMGRKG